MTLQEALQALPLVAILRGLRPEEAVDIGEVLFDAGFRCLEVPLNSPRPYDSIALLAKRFGNTALIGAGTVTTVPEVASVAAAGGRLIVSPHCDVEVIRAAKQRQLYCVPAFMTPTEAFAAIPAGADALKLFPAEAASPAVLKAIRTVLPAQVAILPVGGIHVGNMQPYIAAGARGFGIGSTLYAPGRSRDEVAARAAELAAAWRALQH